MIDKPAVRLASPDELTEKIDDTALARQLIHNAWTGSASQRRLLEDFFAFIDKNEDCLARSCTPGHLTASACVVDQDRNKTLLLRHKKLNRWLQPGGHADRDGNLAHVAWREASEETGIENLRVVLPAIDVDIHPIPPIGSDPAHLHYDLRFIVIAPPHTDIAPNDESTDAAWFGPTDPMILGNTDIERLVEKTFTAIRSL